VGLRVGAGREARRRSIKSAQAARAAVRVRVRARARVRVRVVRIRVRAWARVRVRVRVRLARDGRLGTAAEGRDGGGMGLTQ
jgi:hypothetical protein